MLVHNVGVALKCVFGCRKKKYEYVEAELKSNLMRPKVGDGVCSKCEESLLVEKRAKFELIYKCIVYCLFLYMYEYVD